VLIKIKLRENCQILEFAANLANPLLIAGRQKALYIRGKIRLLEPTAEGFQTDPLWTVIFYQHPNFIAYTPSA